MTPKPAIVLVPGFWLGAWAWDAVATDLRASGFPVNAITLPGLESRDEARAGITLGDQVDAVVSAVRSADAPVILVGHSAAGEIVTGAADAVPESIARLVFVDSGPAADGHVGSPGLDEDIVELELPSWEELRSAGSSLEGLDERALAEFRARAVPHPAGPAREPLRLTNPERHRIPVTLICSSFPSKEVRRMIDAGHPWFAELAMFDTVELVDLPTGHWPMWSRANDTAVAVGRAAGHEIHHPERAL